MVWLKRLVLMVLAAPLVFWLGVQLWLKDADEGTRALVESMPFDELVKVAADMYLPKPARPFTSYDQREYEGRGHNPWVIRSSLDRQPRMLNIAISEDQWLSYNTATGQLYQWWQGDLNFDGAVYNQRHGDEPLSTGTAFVREHSLDSAQAWYYQTTNGDWQQAEYRYLGHRLLSANGPLRLGYALYDSTGNHLANIEESPQLVKETLARDFYFSERSQPAKIALVQLENVSAELAQMRAVAASDQHPALWMFASTGTATDESAPARLTLRAELDGKGSATGVNADAANQALEALLGIPGHSPKTDEDSDKQHLEAEALMAGSDCASCHNREERVVGPSWRELARHYAETAPAKARKILAQRIREGGQGLWTQLPMPPHPEFSQAEAELMASAILATPLQATVSASDIGPADQQQAELRQRYKYSYKTDTAERPETLHPSLQLRELDLPGFEPRVGGITQLADGRLLVVTWDADGAAYLIDNWQSGKPEISRFAEGLQEPLGVVAVASDDGTAAERIFVMQKQEITELIDADGDGWVEHYRNINNSWQASSNFHEFGFGLLASGNELIGGISVCVLSGGKSCLDQLPDRGKLFAVNIDTGELRFIAEGLRTPNGIAEGPDGHIYITDNQGDWLPSSKLLRLEKIDGRDREGAHFGWRSPEAGKRALNRSVTPPVMWLPQNEVGNSPTEPLAIHKGPYAGQLLFGDIYNGGIKRAYIEEIKTESGKSVAQGAAFHFSGGFSGGVNRLQRLSNGDIAVGQIGNPGNWGEPGKQWHGLQIVRPSDTPAFEVLSMQATPNGFLLRFTQPLAEGIAAETIVKKAQSWFYHPASMYGGPKYDVQDMVLSEVRLSQDRRVVELNIEGLEAGRVVYLRLNDKLRSRSDEPLWVSEAWYTLNQVPQHYPAAPRASAAIEMAAGTTEQANHNQLSNAEIDAGWELLFDGESFDGWRNFGAAKAGEADKDLVKEESIRGWAIENGSLKMTRDTSFFGFVLNYLNPFTKTPLLDLMTERSFENFELVLDWRISPGGNSGIFYLVPDDQERVPWKKGFEMQVLDDAGHPDGKILTHRAGDLYDLKSSRAEAARLVGEWNTVRIRVEGDHIRHWLNEELVIDVQRSGPEWEAMLAKSKFADWEGYGQAKRGHIVLQDHGDHVWYRNIKIRELPATQP